MLALALAAAALLAMAAPSSGALGQPADIWLLVDTRSLTLSVMAGEEILHTYENIAIGSNGPTLQKRTMDQKTPLGNFRISEIRASDRFHLFLGIDYPTMGHARRALEEGRLGDREYQLLSQAWRKGQPPPQDTSLGGHLGIHGIGAGSQEIHNDFNWTDGCIAMTNEQVDELATWIRVGTPVSIR